MSRFREGTVGPLLAETVGTLPSDHTAICISPNPIASTELAMFIAVTDRFEKRQDGTHGKPKVLEASHELSSNSGGLTKTSFAVGCHIQSKSVLGNVTPFARSLDSPVAPADLAAVRSRTWSVLCEECKPAPRRYASGGPAVSGQLVRLRDATDDRLWVLISGDWWLSRLERTRRTRRPREVFDYLHVMPLTPVVRSASNSPLLPVIDDPDAPGESLQVHFGRLKTVLLRSVHATPHAVNVGVLAAVAVDLSAGRDLICEAKGTTEAIRRPARYLRTTKRHGRQLAWEWCWKTLIDFAEVGPTTGIFLRLLEPMLFGRVDARASLGLLVKWPQSWNEAVWGAWRDQPMTSVRGFLARSSPASIESALRDCADGLGSAPFTQYEAASLHALISSESQVNGTHRFTTACSEVIVRRKGRRLVLEVHGDVEIRRGLSMGPTQGPSIGQSPEYASWKCVLGHDVTAAFLHTDGGILLDVQEAVTPGGEPCHITWGAYDQPDRDDPWGGALVHQAPLLGGEYLIETWSSESRTSSAMLVLDDPSRGA